MLGFGEFGLGGFGLTKGGFQDGLFGFGDSFLQSLGFGLGSFKTLGGKTRQTLSTHNKRTFSEGAFLASRLLLDSFQVNRL